MPQYHPMIYYWVNQMERLSQKGKEEWEIVWKQLISMHVWLGQALTARWAASARLCL